MKKIFILFAVLFITATSRAYDFSAVAPSGQTLYYNIVNYSGTNNEAEVVAPGSNNTWTGYQKPRGDVIIPDVVTIENNSGVEVTYAIVGIGTGAFKNISNLTSVQIGNNIIYIESEAFKYCPQLETVTLGNTVRSIGADAFYGTSNVDDLHYSGTLRQWCDIDFDDMQSVIENERFYVGNSLITDLVIPNNVHKLKKYAFCGMNGIQTVTIPTSVTEMEVDAIATTRYNLPYPLYYEGTLTQWLNMTKNMNGGVEFELYCQGQLIDDVTIPADITRLKDYALYGTGSLTSVTIPESVRQFGHCVFGDCSNLQEITVLSRNPAYAPDAFCGGSWATWRLIVPCGTLDAYSSAPGWQEFQEYYGGINEDCNDGIEDIFYENIQIASANGNVSITNAENEAISVIDVYGREIYYNPHVESVTIPVATGIYMVRIGLRPAKKVVVIK